MIPAALVALAALLAAAGTVWLALILTLTVPPVGGPYILLILAVALITAHAILYRPKGTRP